MDTRHESIKEGFANHIILTINNYILNNIDTLVSDKILQNELIDICERIYLYLGMEVDCENILSNHNLLSKDVVVFPHATDPEASKILNDIDFEKLIHAIKNTLQQFKNTDLKDKLLDIVSEACNANHSE